MDTLPLFTSGRARLLDSPRLISQFAALERRTFSTGRERIDPGPGHDDLCNSAAIAMSLVGKHAGPILVSDAALARSTMPDPRHFGTTGWDGKPGTPYTPRFLR